MSKGPVLIDLEGKAAEQGPDTAPPVPDIAPVPQGQAMQAVATLAARRPSRLARWFWSILLTLLGVVVSVAAWDFVTGLLARSPVLGWTVTGLLALLGLVMLAIALKELSAFSRLRRIDTLQAEAEEALSERDLGKARRVVSRLTSFYAGREETRWGRDRLEEYGGDQFEAADLLGLAEVELLGPLDQAALREVEAAARQVATVTAIVPLALADVVAALTSNIRMIRRVAEIYGGRSGTLGSWRLTRAVMTHLVATGAVAIGDDLIGSVAGGSVLSKISRRFGEGIVNGALTARVGVAAIEVCRPLPFARAKRPSVTGLVKRALSGLFVKG
ncbi:MULTISPECIES: YcjF family protein [unclassified Roseovarius]|uniref:YcjF family protein n=1 Tax=unclassified Roseovarius TaxID=2614913 RepID=UPI00273F4E34|nr:MULTISPECIES: TIGR01620 family protein [unclassified Roseovarius]